jgi:opacity protein-like surface antigen
MLNLSKLIISSVLISCCFTTASFADSSKVFPGRYDVPYDPSDMDVYIAKPHPQPPTNNYYVGLHLGLASATSQYDTDYPLQQSLTLENKGSLPFFVSLFFGGGGFWDNLYAGVEAQANFNSIETTKDLTGGAGQKSGELSIKIPYTAALDFRPGYLFNQQVIVYGRLGIAGSMLKVSNELSPAEDVSKFIPGLRLGLGVDAFVTTDWSLRFDYVFTKYLDADSSYNLTKTKVVNNTYGEKMHQFGIGVAYHF